MIKKILAYALAGAMILSSMAFPAFAEETNPEEHTHTVGSWVAGEDGNTCVKKCRTCGEVVESHATDWSAWDAPANGNRNYCRRACSECKREDKYHRTEGTWIGQGAEEYRRVCTECGAVETCDHSKGWGQWRIDGENCVRKCLNYNCPRTETHQSEWNDYVGVNEKEKHYCTGRYCTAIDSNGKACNNVNRINTVEELQAAIAAGLETIQPDAWEPYFDPTISGRQAINSPITITEDVTIDGGEAGVTIQRLGFGYGGSKTPTFIVENGAALTLKNLTIRGGGGDMSGSAMILINDGTVILDDGAVLTNGGTYGPCSGIHLNGGNLVMNEGSKITGIVSDSSVYVEKGIFTMNGGEISGNNITGVGSQGVVMVSGSEPESAKFIMNGGSICQSKDTQGYGAGTVIINCGDVTINDGKIIDNAAGFSGGICMGKGSLTITGGEISGNTGVIGAGVVTESALSGILGGVPEGTTSITISGGIIKDNEAVGDYVGLFPSSDVMLAFTDAEITGGEIDTFSGNNEILEFMGVENPDNITDEELDSLGLTREQLAINLAISGGTFKTDVQMYVAAESAEISYSANGETIYAVGEMSTAALLKGVGEGAVVTVVTGTEVKGIPEGVTVVNSTGSPVSVNGGSAIEPGETTVAREYKWISVQFEDVTAADAEGEKIYNINLTATDNEIINRLNSADLTFDFEQLEGKTGYEMIASNSEISVNPVENSAVRYEFHYNGKDNVTTDSANTITIGQVKFEGYGKFSFAVDASAETNVVHTTKTADNLVDTFVPDGDTAVLVIDKAKLVDVEIAVPTRELTVNVTFPNAVEDNAAEYQAMKVVISGGDLTSDKIFALGSGEGGTAMEGGVYAVRTDLAKDNAYTVTVSGEGYRTARYTVNMTEDKTLNFWNNAKDSAAEVEEGNTNSKKTVTYLAGDIVKDNNINIYDLSAVVSYFGTIADTNAYSKYAKYDLNRDGKIDSKDVAMVLVSWGK